ncbi:uncharacterized protein LOC110725314 isoform X1 [Chenopodium quinoa]|uniref:Uncharacterized protein n=1 Tax=Chenopodium quinoa TaxID=63459 RepID=A0A803M592_CHEQI|nr:uncharacterized protein LOC110725314 isoform X1 [Chenopodium quinoa]
MGKLEKQQKWSVNRVIVTVYEESSTSGPRPRKIRTITPKSTTPSCGYDRRADLLAYAHHLRNVGSQQIQHDHSPTVFSNLPNKPKRRRRWFARLKALKFSFGRLFGREKKKAWKYENVESRDRENRYRTSPSPRRGRGRCSKFSKKLGYVLKQFSCGSKCSKGGFDRNDDQYQDLRNNS